MKNIKLYNDVRDVDLITREFKVHKHCYQDFTHGFTSGNASDKKASIPQNSPHPSIHEKGDLDKVKKFIKFIIEEGQCISMNILHEIYDLGVDGTRYRSKLKQTLKDFLKIVFHFFHPPIKILQSRPGNIGKRCHPE